MQRLCRPHYPYLTIYVPNSGHFSSPVWGQPPAIACGIRRGNDSIRGVREVHDQASSFQSLATSVACLPASPICTLHRCYRPTSFVSFYSQYHQAVWSGRWVSLQVYAITRIMIHRRRKKSNFFFLLILTEVGGCSNKNLRSSLLTKVF